MRSASILGGSLDPGAGKGRACLARPSGVERRPTGLRTLPGQPAHFQPGGLRRTMGVHRARSHSWQEAS